MIIPQIVHYMVEKNPLLSLDRVASNLHTVTIGKLKLFYSYKTVIAYENAGKLTVCENVWTHTTGKHLNIIDRDKSERLAHEVFLRRLSDMLSRYGASKGLATL